MKHKKTSIILGIFFLLHLSLMGSYITLLNNDNYDGGRFKINSSGAWNYTGTSHYIGDQDIFPEGFFWDGTYWWMIGSNSDQIHKYYSDWTYTGISHDISGQFTTPTDIFWDGTNWWGLGDGTADRVYKYDSNWSYTGISHYVGGQEPAPKGIFWDGMNWWLVGLHNRVVYKYNSDWSYAGESHYLGGQMDYPSDLYWDGVNWWVPGVYNNRVYIYNSDWSYTGSSYDLGGLDTNPEDVFSDGNYWYMLGYENSRVYQFYNGEIINPIPLDDNILAWYTTWGGDQADYTSSMDIDKENNIYLAGYTESYGAGDEDLLLLKFNSSGALQWNVTWGDSNRDYAGKVAVDSDGYVYLAGSNQGDMWLIKYNSSGEIEWNKELWHSSGSFTYSPGDFRIDSSDNLYIVGNRINTTGDHRDIMIMKYNTSGTLVWVEYWGQNNSYREIGYGLAFDSFEDLYVTGRIDSFEPGTTDLILLKFNKTGDFQWNKTWDVGYLNIGKDIILDSFNNIYITGLTDYSGLGNRDVILLKYNSAGAFQWNKTWDGSDTDSGQGIICDSMDNIYITGYTQLLGGDNDILITKYDSQGNVKWMKVWGPGVKDNGIKFVINSNENIFIGGSHLATDNFDIILLKLRSLGRFNLTSDWDKPDPDGNFNLTWSTSDYANNYSIYMHNTFISEINESVSLLDTGIKDLNYSISGLTNGIYYYKVVAFNDIGNQSSNCIDVDVKIAPQIIFSPTLEYLNTTEPMETDLSLVINCTVLNSTVLQWVYLSENSTGVFNNRSMVLGANNEWTYILDISFLQQGDEISYLFFVRDLNYIKKNDNLNANFSLFIGDIYAPSSNIKFNVSYDPNFISQSTLFNINSSDVGERPTGVFNISYRIDMGLWTEYKSLFNLSDFGEGLHTIYFNATDNAGNIENANQIEVFLDINNITSFIEIIYYEDSGIKYVSNDTEFSINWSDGSGSGLQYLYVSVDSNPYTGYNGSFTLNGYNEGHHNISIYTIDNVGNIEPEKEFEIYLDITPPELDLLSFELLHVPNYVYEATFFTFGGSEIFGSLIEDYYWKIDDGNWNAGTNFTLNGFGSGEHTIHYSVTDNMGNSKNTTIVVYLVTSTTDIDNDGLTYNEELLHNTDPFIDDTDGDKLLDGEEVNVYKTNPVSQDTDGDGYSDYDEIFIFNTDPLSMFSSPFIQIMLLVLIILAISTIVIIIVVRIFHPIALIKDKKQKKKREKESKFESLLRTSKLLLNNGKQSLSKKDYSTAIDNWNEAINNYKLALKEAITREDEIKIEENIRILKEYVYDTLLVSGKEHDSKAKKAHKKENVQKAHQEWSEATNDFQIALDIIKSEKLGVPFSNIEVKINSIKINLKQLNIEKECLEINQVIKQARSLHSKDLVQAIKLTQDSLLRYSAVKKQADEFPEFQELVRNIMIKIENTRRYQIELQDEMDELIGITPLTINGFNDRTLEIEEEGKRSTILKAEKRETGISIIREYEFIGGKVRFKLALINNTRNPLTSFKISFDIPDALKWIIHEPKYERKGDTILVPKLGANEKKAISLYLEPINCLNSPINATISFFDSKDRPQAITMEPKMIVVTCPIFFTREDANLARVKHLYHSIEHRDKKLFPINKPEQAPLVFASVLSVLGSHDIKLIFKDYVEGDQLGEAWFYGVTKVKSNKIITHVLIDGVKRILDLEVSGDSDEQITAFLAELSNQIRQELIKQNVLSPDDRFYDMLISVIEHTCPYCGESIQIELAQSYLNGESIKCNYCNVIIQIHDE